MDARAIERKLREIEGREGVEILYACESGSRAWGFASPDSDFDVRFLYRQPLERYLTAGRIEDTMVVMEGVFDGSGWDLIKAGSLLLKSNGSLLEWLHSPVVYRSKEGFLERWREVGGQFSRVALIHHYRGLTVKMVSGSLIERWRRPKDYLYGLRAILAAQWILEHDCQPPVAFEELIPIAPPGVREKIEELLRLKVKTSEGHRIEPMQGLDQFLKVSLEEISERVETLSSRGPTRRSVDGLLQEELVPSRRGAALREPDFSVQRVRQSDMLFLDVIAGSHAYGTNVEGSDLDRRGIFVAPPGFLLGLHRIKQVSDQRQDQVYFELGRFFELALKSNPNVLELLAIPEECIQKRHPLFLSLSQGLFLSKECARTFSEYAMGQIRKARGLNKKIIDPEPEIRRSVLEYCEILSQAGSVPLLQWLDDHELKAEECGLTSLADAHNVFALYGGDDGNYRGLVSERSRDALIISQIRASARPRAWMVFRGDAFRAHCKAHREYWQWVKERNEERFSVNAGQGGGYDGKNLMHTFRLLEMAREIAEEGRLRVRRPNRAFLLQVRAGEFSYQEVLARVEESLARVEEAFEKSDLPETPDVDRVNDLLLEIRSRF